MFAVWEGETEKKHKNRGVHRELSVSLGVVLERLERLVDFWGGLSKKTQNPKNRTVCRPTFYLRLTIIFSNYPGSLCTFTS